MTADNLSAPHSDDMERAALAVVLYQRVAPSTLGLEGTDFYNPDHEALWNVLEAMEQAGEGVDPITAADSLRGSGAVLADPNLVTNLAGGPCLAANASQYAETIRTASRSRHALTALERAAQRVSAGENPAEVMADLDAMPKRSGDGIVKAWKATDLAESKPLEWLALGRIPFASVAAMAGNEGIGKSLFDAWLCAAVTTGRAVPGFGIPARDPMDVCLVLTEDDWQTIARPRFEAAGVDMDHVYVVCESRDGSGSPEFPKDMRPVYDSGAPLVLVDCFADTVEARLTLKDGQQARKALHPWKEFASRTGASVLLLTHTNRTDTRSTRNAWGYSAEIRKKVRVGLLAQEDEDGLLAIGSDKINVDGKGTASTFEIREVQFWDPTPSSRGVVPVLEYVGESDYTTRELFAQAYDREHPQPEKAGRALGDDSGKVVEFIAAKAKAGTVVDAQQVAKGMDWTPKQAADRLRKLADGGYIRRVTRGIYAPNDSPDSPLSPFRLRHQSSGERVGGSDSPESIRLNVGTTGDTAKEAKEAKPAEPVTPALSLVPDDPCPMCGHSLTGTPGQRLCAARHRRAQEAAS